MLKIRVSCRCLGEMATLDHTAAGSQAPARVMMQGEENPWEQRMGSGGYFWQGAGGHPAQNELVMPQFPLSS